MATGDPWAGLSHDPRLPEHAHLRSAQRDRDAVAQVLAESFADGRLDRDEFDARAETLTGSRTLGELPPLVADLVPPPPLHQPTSYQSGLPLEQVEAIRARALQRYERRRRDSLWTLISVSLICFTVWGVGSLGDGPGFPWPLIVLAALAAHHVRVVLERRRSIEEETRRLERKALKAQQRRARRQLPPGA
ncbi:DUF1707 SHOCT-like domain-containing protein [Nocardioides houyundeii]|uniref:DUF1707 SHOCT-like domain-containing protein n=1 Tax=Nocardioides houyundeii TaxID=2045452 RepID=UPI000DF13833|nr:DUF1707 domain-containing protein [Nocardioides houyundeii]